MKPATLEHVNVTVSDPDQTAGLLCDLFGWKIRWAGAAMQNGRSVHVGSDASYVALYGPPSSVAADHGAGAVRGGLNHIAVTVSDLNAVEERVKKAGFTPHSYGAYEPGRRFYFNDPDGVEYEVVSYNG